MDGNEYLLEMLVRERLDEARAAGAWRALGARARPSRPPFRVRVGAALIALGERLAGTPTPRRACAPSSASHG